MRPLLRLPLHRQHTHTVVEADVAAPHRLERGQALVMFILMSVVMIGAVSIVTDIAWVWYGQQRMQRAADAAALAGAIYLPGDPTGAYAAARAESARNGFTDGSGGVTVTPVKDPLNGRRIIVTVSGPVRSFFARALGITTFSTGATSRAEYVLPVPMGSPENYYGVGYYIATSSETHDVTTTGSTTTGTSGTGTWVYTPGNWTSPAAVRTQDCANGTGACGTYATSASAASSPQVFGQMGVNVGSAPAANQSFVVPGIEVRVRARLNTATPSGCKLTTELSWDGGTTWSTGVDLPLTSNGFLSTGGGYVSQGSPSSTAAWGPHTWTYNDFSNTNFQSRLTWTRGSGCGSTIVAQVDYLQVRVSYRVDTTNPVTTYSNDGPQDLVGPNGETIRRQGFWGSMQSQGAPNIQGDAFMTYYNTRTSVNNAGYDPNAYYQYGVEMPAGASNGKVWVYDPGFCDVTTSAGTGEYWTIGGSNGASSPQPVTSYFDLYDTNNTPYDISDDSLVTSFNNDYRRSNYQDLTARRAINGSGDSVAGNPPDCHTLTWHDHWVLLASGLTGGGSGKTYRLHTYSFDASSPTDQLSSTALNGFAFFANAAGGTPRLYGIGAMEAYARLPGGQATEFYMAQIAGVHAGKTMVIELWDPGDTGSLSASLQILKPTAADYVPATFSYAASQGSSSSGVSACNSQAGTNVTAVTTNTGGSSLFNGCWLTITIPLPATYTAPHPATDTITTDGGWWKIKYTMGGSSTSFSTDLTTWKVSIRGNPVHLVVP